jgi:hypothetical protein
MSESLNLQNIDTLIHVLNEVSRELTNVIKSVNKTLNLDQDVELLISLRYFTEPRIEGAIEGESRRVICGYYNPEVKQIVLSYLCLIDGEELNFNRLFETIAHELIHHCQYTCATSSCREICEVSISIDKCHEIKEMLPYGLRPHEIEAYKKQDALADVIRRILGDEIKTLVQKLDATLRPPLHLIQQHLSRNLCLSFSPLFCRNSVETLINRFVDKNKVRDKLVQISNYYKDQRIVDEIKRMISDVEALIESYVSHFLDSFKRLYKEGVFIDSIFLTSSTCIGNNESKFTGVITTNSDFVLILTLNIESPLATIKLKPLERVSILEFFEKFKYVPPSSIGLQQVYMNSRINDLSMHLRKVSCSKLLRSIAKHLCDAKKGISKDLKGLIGLIQLLNAGEDTVVEQIKLNSLNVELIRIRTKTAKDSTLEALLCNNRITIKGRELDMLEVLKAIINAEATDKNVAEALNEHFVDDLNNYAEEKARAKLVLEELSRILKELKIE